MSYARFGVNGSDVYVFQNRDGHLECCGCQMAKRGDTVNGKWTCKLRPGHPGQHQDGLILWGRR